mmetsp:Transcript_17066/g.46838  ORF Transcript_17066/g.46838 Transcript_17066/m.46838 type:complete len:215 (+) Transcript_17066:25-669(+)
MPSTTRATVGGPWLPSRGAFRGWGLAGRWVQTPSGPGASFWPRTAGGRGPGGQARMWGWPGRLAQAPAQKKASFHHPLFSCRSTLPAPARSAPAAAAAIRGWGSWRQLWERRRRVLGAAACGWQPSFGREWRSWEGRWQCLGARSRSSLLPRSPKPTPSQPLTGPALFIQCLASLPGDLLVMVVRLAILRLWPRCHRQPWHRGRLQGPPFRPGA